VGVFVLVDKEQDYSQGKHADPETVAAKHISRIVNDGYTLIRGAVPQDDIDRVMDDYLSWTEKNKALTAQFKKSSGFNSRLVNFHSVSNHAFNLFQNQKLLAVTDGFFNQESAVYTSLFFQEGTEQNIHRDAPYFCTFPEQKFLGVWFALEDATSLNGALNVLPGGQLLALNEYAKRHEILSKHYPLDGQSSRNLFVGSLNRLKSFVQQLRKVERLPEGAGWSRQIGFVEPTLWDDYQAWVLEDCLSKGLKVRHIEAKKGDIIIWHPMLPHGGSKIVQKGNTRYSMVMHVTPVGTQVHGSYLFFAPHSPFTPRPMAYTQSTELMHRSMFTSGCSFMKDE